MPSAAAAPVPTTRSSASRVVGAGWDPAAGAGAALMFLALLTAGSPLVTRVMDVVAGVPPLVEVAPAVVVVVEAAEVDPLLPQPAARAPSATSARTAPRPLMPAPASPGCPPGR